ncbi:MAG: hypothetical protein HUU35_17105 [Armatimonadetes bacterium]|nr:hypothetical protein [Armatimonadota bacterium]
MAQLTDWSERVKHLRDPNPTVAVSKAYQDIVVAIVLAAQRAGISTPQDPATALAQLVESEKVPHQAATMFATLADAHSRAVAREAEPSPEEAGDYERYASTLVQTMNGVH